MQLDVSKALNAAGQELPFSGEVVLSDSVLMGEPIVFPAPAALHGLYASVGDAIHVRGQMTFPVRARCVRCLTESERTLTADFDATFALSPDPTDPDLYAYDGALGRFVGHGRGRRQLACHAVAVQPGHARGFARCAERIAT